VADEEVLTTGVDEGWVKAIDGKYVAEDFNGNPKVPQSYWGWMKMALGASHGLWAGIEVHEEMCDLAPETNTGVHDRVFDGRDIS
jgi:hypothetical protein